MEKNDTDDSELGGRFDETHESYDQADFDAIKASDRTGEFRADTDTVFFARQLDYVKSRIYVRKYPALSGNVMVPTRSDAPEYAESITTRTYDEVGIAKVISNYADDLPRADVRAIERTVRVKTIGDAYGYNINEIRASRALGTGLDVRKAGAARRAVEQKLNRVIFQGDPDYGLLGLYNNPNIAIVTPLTGDWANANTDGAEILADLNALYNAIITQSNGVHMPNMCSMPATQVSIAGSKTLPNMPGETPLSFFRKQHPEITFRIVYENKGAGTAGTDIMFMYEMSEENLGHELVMPFNQLPPQERNLEFLINCMCRSAGVQIDYPLAFAKMEGI